MKHIKFRVAEREYAIDIGQISEVIRMGEIVPVPKSADFVKGVIRLRGKIIPLISLRERFGIQEERSGAVSRVLVGEVDGNPLGLIVDEVDGVVSIEENQVQEQGSVLKNADYLHGIGKLENGLVLILDLEKILKHDEKKEIPVNAEET